MMTETQVELLMFLNECGPITCNAIYNIWLHMKGMAFSTVGNCLRALERSGWATGILAMEVSEFGYKAYLLRNRKLWAITWAGYQMLQKWIKRIEKEGTDDSATG